MSKPFTWSYSALTAFETCPKRYYHTKVSKDTADPMGEAARAGLAMHKAMEDAANGVAALPGNYSHLKPIVDRVRAAPGERLVESRFGITDALQPTTFFAKDVWMRGVIDFGVVNGTKATILDWKTGKRKDDHDQLGLFAGTIFAHYPKVEIVKTGYVWLQSRETTQREFTRETIHEDVWHPMLVRVERMSKAIEAERFPARPSGLCRNYCPVRHCDHCGV